MNINKPINNSEMINPQVNKNFSNDAEVIKDKIHPLRVKAGDIISGEFFHKKNWKPFKNLRTGEVVQITQVIEAKILEECPITQCRTEGIPIEYKLSDSRISSEYTSLHALDHLSWEDCEILGIKIVP